MTVLQKGERSSCYEEVAAPKKKLLCQSSYSEKLWNFSTTNLCLGTVATYARMEIARKNLN